MNYEKKIDWEEVNCSKKNNENRISKKVDVEKSKRKLIEHQLKLKELGYNIVVNGILDDKTKTEHNEYIYHQNKLKRKKKRLEKRQKRKK